MDDDQLRWAEALAIERIHREAGPRWIAGRIGALAIAGDEGGVARLKQIAQRYELLLNGKAASA